MSLEQKTGSSRHFFEALPKLVSAFWGKPRIAALLQAYVQRVQELEDATWAVMDRYTVAVADTTRLDILGRVVGQPRFWSNDEIYRSVIRGKIRANRSRGLTDDIVDVVQCVTPTSDPVHVAHYSPATMFVWPEAPIDAATDLIALKFLLPKTRAAGVRMQFFWTTAGIDTAMVWDEATWDDGSVTWTVEYL